jgi:hypothetical protein
MLHWVDLHASRAYKKLVATAIPHCYQPLRDRMVLHPRNLKLNMIMFVTLYQHSYQSGLK